MKGRFYNWMLTKNLKKSEQDLEELWKVEYLDGKPKIPNTKVQYCIWTLEKVDNLHYHFYIEFTEKVSMKWIKENFECDYIDCEPRKGTQKQAINYVKKIEEYKEENTSKVYPDKPWYECGNKKSQGNRSDLDSMVDMLEEGYMPSDILRTFRGNALRHMGMIYRGVDALYKLSAQDRALDHLSLEERKNWLSKDA